MGGDETEAYHILLALEAFGGLAIGLEAAERDGLYLIVLIQFPLAGGMGSDDQVLIVVLGATDLYQRYEQQGANN